jgi:pilus assembly protein CpaF
MDGDRGIAEFGKYCADNNILINNAVVNAPDASIGGSLVDPADRAKYIARLHETIKVCKDINCQAAITCTGNALPGVSYEEQKQCVIDTLKAAAEVAEAENFNLFLESLNTLVDQIYDDLFGFGILTQYIYDEKVQEIIGNRWDDIEIITADGYFKLSDKFASPRQAQAVVRRMAQLGGVTVDGSTPDGDSYITEGVRIHVKVPPIIDEKAAVQFSIRKQRRAVFTREEFIKRETATAAELGFLSLALAHGVSIGIAGSAGSGKTTDVSFLLNTMPSSLRIYVIEEAREIQLEKQNEKGLYVSRVMHTKTRYDQNAVYNIDARRLVRDALWCDPDIIVPAEMRGAEALDVMEAGRTGHTIISTFHAQGNEDAYKRIASMAMMAGAGYSENMLLSFAYASFPLMVYKVQLADGTRKYVEIAEAQRDTVADD